MYLHGPGTDPHRPGHFHRGNTEHKSGAGTGRQFLWHCLWIHGLLSHLQGDASFTLFKVTPAGALSTLYTFDGSSGSGIFAAGSLLQATDGYLYGTTQYGGINAYGTVFKISLAGAFTTLHSFDGNDGDFPVTGVIQATDGNFYGVTQGGGAIDAPLGGTGTFYKITSQGVLTTLVNLPPTPGTYPPIRPNAVIQATNGDFYGTSYQGGLDAGSYSDGYGTAFRITPAGMFQNVYDFPGYPGPSNPYAALVQGNDGDFYGATIEGGNAEAGTLFRMSPRGVVTKLHVFNGRDGVNPNSALIQATDGNFYGTARQSIFKVTPEGAFTTLYFFTEANQIYYTVGALLQATDGNLYGVAQTNTATHSGIVYKLSLGLRPFVKTLPSAGSAGAEVLILGTDLTGVTGVSFNGKPATFTIASSSAITATVPAGATTGTVRVTGPGQTLLSNVPFRVIQ